MRNLFTTFPLKHLTCKAVLVHFVHYLSMAAQVNKLWQISVFLFYHRRGDGRVRSQVSDKLSVPERDFRRGKPAWWARVSDFGKYSRLQPEEFTGVTTGSQNIAAEIERSLITTLRRQTIWQRLGAGSGPCVQADEVQVVRRRREGAGETSALPSRT